MSINAICATQRVRGISHGGFRVLITLASMSADDGICWPTNSKIAEDCEMTEEEVVEHLTAFYQRGLILLDRRPVHKRTLSLKPMIDAYERAGR